MFDPILQAGKTAQVTQDVTNINPYAAVFDDVAHLIVPSVTVGSGFAQSGSLINVYNNLFDYTVADPYYLTQVGGGSTSATLLFDLGKSLSLRGILLYWVATQTSGINTIQIQYSIDNVNYTTLETFTIAGSSVETNRTYNSVQVRYFRLVFNTSAGGPGTTFGFIFRRLEMRIDSSQLVR